MNAIDVITNKTKNLDNSPKMKILVFTEGTIIEPPNILSHFICSRYIPIGKASERICGWYKQGAQIIYLTSRKKKSQIAAIATILKKYEFASGILLYREGKEQYKDIIENVKPDVLIEDDCKSIGGARQMCITYVTPDIKNRIKSIIVKEFNGIDHLPSELADLLFV